MVAFLIQPPHTHAVYAISGDIIELDYAKDILVDVVEFDIVFDPFRDPSMVVIDLSRLPTR